MIRLVRLILYTCVWWAIGAASVVGYFRYVQTTYIAVENVDLESMVVKFNQMLAYAHSLRPSCRQDAILTILRRRYE